MVSIAVIGAGMIGAAAARHLAKLGHDVCLIGPAEPDDKVGHDGVFASHYDAGRITRVIDPDPFWSRVSAESIARYAEIAQEGEQEFYTERGLLMVGPVGHASIDSAEAVARAASSPCEALDRDALAKRFPEFSFGPSDRGLFEPSVAGFIDPRALVRAQVRAAQKAGARVVRAVVQGVTEEAGAVRISTDQGEAIMADQVLVAAGGFSNMVLPKPLPLRVMPRTVLMAEVSEAEADRLCDLPPLIQYYDGAPYMYLLPPIRYPDGRFYIKLGGDPRDQVLQDTDQIKAWFRQGGDMSVGAHLDQILTGVMPETELGARQVAACVVTYAGDDERPVLQRVSDRISVATAGCGRGAKCSDELGRLGGLVTLGEALPEWAV